MCDFRMMVGHSEEQMRKERKVGFWVAARSLSSPDSVKGQVLGTTDLDGLNALR